MTDQFQKHLAPPPVDHPDEKAHRRTIARTVGAILREEGLPHRWDTLRMPGPSGRLGGAADPGFKRFQLSATLSSQGVFAFHFGPAAVTELFFTCELPHTYAEGTDLTPYVRWSPTTVGGAVVWGIEYTKANMNGTFGPTVKLEATASASAILTHQASSLGTITGTGIGISSLLLVRLYRKATDAGDTNSSSAAFLELDILAEHDTRGSLAPVSKWAAG